MKNFAVVFAIILSAILCGCASVEVQRGTKNMVVIQNSGCFLFGCVPICSGDPNYPNQDVCNWFENTVKLETNVRLLNETAEENGAVGIQNISSHLDNESILWFILKRKIYKTSAELVR